MKFFGDHKIVKSENAEETTEAPISLDEKNAMIQAKIDEITLAHHEDTLATLDEIIETVEAQEFDLALKLAPNLVLRHDEITRTLRAFHSIGIAYVGDADLDASIIVLAQAVIQLSELRAQLEDAIAAIPFTEVEPVSDVTIVLVEC